MKIFHLKSLTVLIVIVCLGLLSCHDNKDNPIDAGREYCDCMARTVSTKPYFAARSSCDSELFPKYRLFRIERLYLRKYDTQKKISYETEDSVGKFINAMDEYTRANCCKIVLNCPLDSTKK